MLPTFAFLIALVILGDALVAATGLPVPGPAVGLAVLTAAFAWEGRPLPGFERLFALAAPWFPLFFVPAAVGVVAHLALLSSAWLHVAVAIVFGTALALLITGQVAQVLLALAAKKKSDA
jgi:holin-like protein